MPKDVIITPASGLVDFQSNTGISSATIQLDDNGNLNIANPGGDLTIGDTNRDIFIGDGTNNVDLIFEQDGEIRGLTNKTIGLGQTDSYIKIVGGLKDANNSVGAGGSILVSTGSGVIWSSASGAGAQGTQGSQGTQGLQGTQGNQGRQGAQGIQGSQGAQNSQGTQGLQGSQGSQGRQGAQGIQGSQGSQGTQGLQGSQGSQGTQGIQGSQGRQGTQGLGNQGLQGPQGSQGSQGVQGLSNQGSQGSQNSQGTQGLQGSQGSQGRQGAQGTPGTNAGQGAQGSQGSQGVQGLSNQGSQGTQNSQGTQGLQGSQGRQGTQGIAGQNAGQGSQGLQGSQGRQGTQGLSNQGVQGTAAAVSPSTITRTSFTATEGQTTFSVSYTPNFILVYLNGSNLETSEYTASNGTSVILGTGASLGDVIEVVSFTLGNYVTSPQGTQGAQGRQGSQGALSNFQGTQGSQGLQGAQGRQGIQGPLSNFQGTQGVSGTAGNTLTFDVTNTTTNSTFYPVFVGGTGLQAPNIRQTATAYSFNASTGNLVVPGTVTASSDESIKTNIHPIENALEKVLQLRGVEFNYKEHGTKSIGVIAQEVEKIFPELVYGDKIKSVAYQNLVAVLIEAIKELYDKYENGR